MCVFNSIFDISFPKIHVCLYFPMCQSCEHILRVQSTAVTGKKFSHTEIKNRILCFLCLDFILFLERKRKRIEAWNGTKCFIFPFIAYWHCWCPLVDEFFLFEVLLDGYEQLWEWHIGSVGTLWSTQIIIFCISCSLLLSWIRNFNFVYAVFAVLNASLKKALETIKLRFN